MEWDEAFREHVRMLTEKKPVIICGDFNVARSEIDIYAENMRQYWAEQGYSSDERSAFESLLEEGLIDVFRELYPEKRSYTWWSNRLNNLKGLNVEVKKMLGCYCLYCDGQAVGWIHDSVISLREVGLTYLPEDIKRPAKGNKIQELVKRVMP